MAGVRQADFIRTEVLMDTLVTIQLPHEAAARAGPAFKWFHQVEACCSRFDPASELRQLTDRSGAPVPVSAMLFQAIQFALMIAEQSGGAFDPTIGRAMEQRGFNREHRTGQVTATSITAGDVSFRDVHLDPDNQTITLTQPLVLDLGAVAKGLAIDLAAHELEDVRNFAIDAGGDLYLAGCRPDGNAWSVGIRHPRSNRSSEGEPLRRDIVEVLHVSDVAVCTSGDYERRKSDGGDEHHIIDPRTGRSTTKLASVTVVASKAMLADAVATAAFVLGPDEGLKLCENLGVDALMLSPTCERYATRGMHSGQYRSSATVLPDTQGSADDRFRNPDRRRRAPRRV